jgi:flavorubredoxin
LKALKFNVPLEGMAVKFSPDDKKHEQVVEFGREFARHLND